MLLVIFLVNSFFNWLVYYFIELIFVSIFFQAFFIIISLNSFLILSADFRHLFLIIYAFLIIFVDLLVYGAQLL